MSVLRIHKKKNNFVILDKTCLNDTKLSWGAKGLHAYLISLPDDWRVQVENLRMMAKNGRDAVRAFLNELEEAGYIKKSRERDSANGQFKGVEYLVLEVSEPYNDEETPAPEKPSLEENWNIFPEHENPGTGKPGPGNTTLLNNNKINNKTAAEIIVEEEKAAAVIFSQKQTLQNTTQSFHQKTKIAVLSQADATIGETLTANQIKRVYDFVDGLNAENKQELIKEVHHALLTASHFTACGKDFSKKLNAIRSVILKGNWQTPVGMVSVSQKKISQTTNVVEKELQTAKSEALHFQRFLLNAKGDTKAELEEILKKIEQKIASLECMIAQEKNHSQFAMIQHFQPHKEA